MNQQYIQGLRYKLQKRVRRLNSSEGHLYVFYFNNFWKFINQIDIFVGILLDLELRHPEQKSIAEAIVNLGEAHIAESEEEEATLANFVIQLTFDSDNDEKLHEIGRAYLSRRSKWDSDDTSEAFYNRFIEPVYEYLDEQLDDQRSILSILRRYKHKCEWFQKEKLYSTWKNNTKSGEALLALSLYEYLHDQGIDFHIEPHSAVGEADIVSMQNSEDPLIADAKIFDPNSSRNVTYIAKGFNQIYLYTLTYNQPFGYLVIYNVSEHDLSFSLNDQEQSVPFIRHNNKTIFLLVIDIYPHITTASKRGTLKSYVVTADDLIVALEEQ